MCLARIFSGLRPILTSVFALFLIAIAGAMDARAQSAPASLTATCRQGELSLTIAYPAMRAGAGVLTAEVLAPEGDVLGRAEARVKVRNSRDAWLLTIVPTKPVDCEEIPWQRVRYRFIYDGDGKPSLADIESISEILSRPVVRIFGQREYVAGSRSAIRVIVRDNKNGTPQLGTLRIDLEAPGERPRTLFSGRLDRHGTAEAGFVFPPGLAGNFAMHFLAETAIGSAEFTQPVELKQKASILLTTEKPIYQPGQTIHARVLALDRATDQAAGRRKLTFEVEDSRGNKVFRKSTETDRFGIASAEFTLADEVNLGAYHLKALMDDPQAPTNSAEVTLNVERYVLPKFQVAVDLTGKDAGNKHGYRPGDHVVGTVRANYFFGNAVDHAQVTVKATGMDVEAFEAAATSGTTDEDGVYHFDLQLPEYFSGKPLHGGAARVLIEATVKDSAAHSETHDEPIIVSESPLVVTAIPEGGALAPGVENEIFLVTSYADGSPARTRLTVYALTSAGGDKVGKGQRLATDDAGVAVIRLRPKEASGKPALQVEADDQHGNRTQSTIPLETRAGSDQILLHADQAVFEAGSRIHLTILSTRAHGAAYIDIVKNGQTILTRDLDLENGQAELTLDATPEMAGTLDVDAYLIGRDGQPVGDHRLIFVEPAQELKIETKSDAAVYRPGGEARIQFHVTDRRGEGVQAALGLEVVDQAVFALAEQQPGFAKVFFYLEQEAMTPRYEIHSLSMSSAVDSGVPGQDEKQLAARALFSATEMADPGKIDVEFGNQATPQKSAEYQQRYYEAFVDQLRELAARLSGKIGEHTNDAEIEQAFAALEPGGPRDAWNTPLRIEPVRWYQGENRYFRISSAGADRKFSSPDDLSAFIEVRSGTVSNPPPQRSTLGLRIEHDRGAVTQFAEAVGTVTDITGAVVPNASVVLDSSEGGRRTAHTDARGRFAFAGLPAVHYAIEITSPGFERLSGAVTLTPRDRAILTAVLVPGAATQAVEVNAAPVMEVTEVEAHARSLGVAGAEDTIAAMAPASPSASEFVVVKSQPQEPHGNLATLAEGSAGDAPHVRSYFPEALYINPEILTDGNGNASITIPVADSITTWRMAMLASTQSGAMGSGESSLKVFQDFFVDLDLPVTLTQGDRVSIPVAVYNYSGKTGHVNLTLLPEDWFALENDAGEKSVTVDSGRVSSAEFTLSAKKIGKFKLTLTAHMAGGAPGDDRDDVIVREIEVVPNGQEQDAVVNGTLDGTAEHDLKFPAGALPGATSILIRLYPGPLSQAIEGMDSILRMPSGCFEQTSSSTYPNVLALDYMKRTQKLTPEIRARAEGFIATGYQRLLTFEVPGGGFSWFGQAPANKILTAYGLMEFGDMAKVADVDPRVIERTRDWLADQQQADGSWEPDSSFINEGATNRYNSDVLRITAYIAWSLKNAGYTGAAIDKARVYIESHDGEAADAYTRAVVANFAVDDGKDREFTRRAMESLLDARQEQGDQLFWTAEETGMYGAGESAAVETTGLAVQALIKWGNAPAQARKALAYLAAKRQASGNWGTTQATIMALRALLLAAQKGTSDVRGTLAVAINGGPTRSLVLDAENNDLLHEFAFENIDPAKPAKVELKLNGSGSLAYQIVGRAFVPWQTEAAKGPLSIDVRYDRTELAQNDIAKATAIIRNNLPQSANMVMVDLGIPPGFELETEDLQDFQEKSAAAASGKLEKFSLTATQAILYFNALAPEQTVTLSYRLRAKYPIRARSFASTVYEYYEPEASATAQPVDFEVTGRK